MQSRNTVNTMPTRRLVLLGGMGAILAGCGAEETVGPPASAADTTAPPDVPAARPQFDATKALTPEDTRNLQIEDVTVALAPEFTRTAPHNGVTSDFILSEMQSTIIPGLKAAKPDGAFPVRAEVEIIRFNFANVAIGLVGPKGSFAAFRTTLYYMDSGEVVGRVATNQATTPPRPTLLGLALIKSAPEEVRTVARRAPDAIAIRLFGRQTP